MDARNDGCGKRVWANGRGKRALYYWIALRFRALTLAMTGGVCLVFNGLSVIFINKCVLMCGMSLRTRQDDE